MPSSILVFRGCYVKGTIDEAGQPGEQGNGSTQMYWTVRHRLRSKFFFFYRLDPIGIAQRVTSIVLL